MKGGGELKPPFLLDGGSTCEEIVFVAADSVVPVKQETAAVLFAYPYIGKELVYLSPTVVISKKILFHDRPPSPVDIKKMSFLLVG